jgi:hypothetical protein
MELKPRKRTESIWFWIWIWSPLDSGAQSKSDSPLDSDPGVQSKSGSSLDSGSGPRARSDSGLDSGSWLARALGLVQFLALRRAKSRREVPKVRLGISTPIRCTLVYQGAPLMCQGSPWCTKVRP